jgi:hypothetical protein
MTASRDPVLTGVCVCAIWISSSRESEYCRPGPGRDESAVRPRTDGRYIGPVPMNSVERPY